LKSATRCAAHHADARSANWSATAHCPKLCRSVATGGAGSLISEHPTCRTGVLVDGAGGLMASSRQTPCASAWSTDCSSLGILINEWTRYRRPFRRTKPPDHGSTAAWAIHHYPAQASTPARLAAASDPMHEPASREGWARLVQRHRFRSLSG